MEADNFMDILCRFLKEYQDEGYPQQDIEEECEYMSYAYIEQGWVNIEYV